MSSPLRTALQGANYVTGGNGRLGGFGGPRPHP
jgi:hypothetical protein